MNISNQPFSARRISLVTETWPPDVNGVAMTTERMVHCLVDRHQVELVRLRQSADELPSDALPYHSLLLPGISLPGYHEVRVGLPCTRKLRRHWQKNRPDLVHVVTEGPLGWSAVRAAHQLGIPVSSDFHTNFHRYSSDYGAKLLQRPVLAYLRHLHNRTRATLVPTADLASELEALGFKGMKVVSRGVDTELFHPRKRQQALRQAWGADDDTPVLMMVSRVAPEKNFSLAIKAFRAVQEQRPKARMVIVGDGPQRQALQSANPDIVFAGMQRGECLAEYYASADIFVFSSQSETFGNVILEAMASGLALVAYRYAAAKEHLVDSRHGFLAEMDDEKAFIQKTVSLANDAYLYRHMGHAAHLTATNLGWERICDDFERTLLENMG